MGDEFSAQASEEHGSFTVASSLHGAGGYHGPCAATTMVGKGQRGHTEPRKATPGSGPRAQDRSQCPWGSPAPGQRPTFISQPYSLALSSPGLSVTACAGLSTNPYSQQVTTAASLLRLQRLRCRRKLCPTI